MKDKSPITKAARVMQSPDLADALNHIDKKIDDLESPEDRLDDLEKELSQLGHVVRNRDYQSLKARVERDYNQKHHALGELRSRVDELEQLLESTFDRNEDTRGVAYKTKNRVDDLEERLDEQPETDHAAISALIGRFEERIEERIRVFEDRVSDDLPLMDADGKIKVEKELRERVEALESRLDDVESIFDFDITEADSTDMNLLQRVMRLEEQANKLERVTDGQDQLDLDLERRLAQVEKRLDEHGRLGADLESRLHDVEETIKNHASSLVDKARELEERRQEIDGLDTRLGRLEDRLDDTEQEVVDRPLQEQLDELESRLSDVEKGEDLQDNYLSDAREKAEKNSMEIGNVRQSIAEVERKADAVRDVISKQKNRIDGLAKAINAKAAAKAVYSKTNDLEAMVETVHEDHDRRLELIEERLTERVLETEKSVDEAHQKIDDTDEVLGRVLEVLDEEGMLLYSPTEEVPFTVGDLDPLDESLSLGLLVGTCQQHDDFGRLVNVHWASNDEDVRSIRVQMEGRPHERYRVTPRLHVEAMEERMLRVDDDARALAQELRRIHVEQEWKRGGTVEPVYVGSETEPTSLDKQAESESIEAGEDHPTLRWRGTPVGAGVYLLQRSEKHELEVVDLVRPCKYSGNRDLKAEIEALDDPDALHLFRGNVVGSPFQSVDHQLLNAARFFGPIPPPHSKPGSSMYLYREIGSVKSEEPPNPAK